MATPRKGTPRGRPKGTKKDFRTDPDRVAVAYAWIILLAERCSENRAYRKAALEIALPISINFDHSSSSVTLQLESEIHHLTDPERATVSRLRKKGARWRENPEARAHIEELMMMIAKIITRQRTSDDRVERHIQVIRDLKAL